MWFFRTWRPCLMLRSRLFCSLLNRRKGDGSQDFVYFSNQYAIVFQAQTWEIKATLSCEKEKRIPPLSSILAFSFFNELQCKYVKVLYRNSYGFIQTYYVKSFCDNNMFFVAAVQLLQSICMGSISDWD